MPKVELTDRFMRYHHGETITDFFDAKTKGLHASRGSNGLESVGGDVHRPGSEKRARMVLGSYPATLPGEGPRRWRWRPTAKVEAGTDPRAEAAQRYDDGRHADRQLRRQARSHHQDRQGFGAATPL